MTAVGTVGMVAPGDHLQRMQTVYRIFTDQHGRKFGAQSDFRNQQPKEELRPVNDDPTNQFTPPWLPPMQYAKFRPDGSLTFRWDYNTMATDLSEMSVDYYQRAMEFALEHNKPEPELGGPIDRSIRFLLGKPPLSPAIPLACEQGDPWLLGVKDAPMNTTLNEILTQGVQSNSKVALEIIRKSLATAAAAAGIELIAPTPEPVEPKGAKSRSITDVDLDATPEVTYKQFMAECRGRGMKQPEVIAMWNEHKALLAENAPAGKK